MRVWPRGGVVGNRLPSFVLVLDVDIIVFFQEYLSRIYAYFILIMKFNFSSHIKIQYLTQKGLLLK